MTEGVDEVRRRETIEAILDDGLNLYVKTTFLYLKADPYAVSIIFSAEKGGEDVPWFFARDLLQDGLESAAGMGDVRIWPSSITKSIYLTVSSPDGKGLFRIRRPVVEKFLAQTVELVPYGDESQYLDIDACIKEIIKQESR